MSNPTGPTILEQLNLAWISKGWSVDQLNKRSGLRLERTTMGKKMRGQLPLKSNEIEKLATCLDTTIVWPLKPRKKAA